MEGVGGKDGTAEVGEDGGDDGRAEMSADAGGGDDKNRAAEPGSAVADVTDDVADVVCVLGVVDEAVVMGTDEVDVIVRFVEGVATAALFATASPSDDDITSISDFLVLDSVPMLLSLVPITLISLSA